MRLTKIETVIRCDDGEACTIAGVGPRQHVVRVPVEEVSAQLAALGWRTANGRDVCPRCLARESER